MLLEQISNYSFRICESDKKLTDLSPPFFWPIGIIVFRSSLRWRPVVPAMSRRTAPDAELLRPDYGDLRTLTQGQATDYENSPSPAVPLRKRPDNASSCLHTCNLHPSRRAARRSFLLFANPVFRVARDK